MKLIISASVLLLFSSCSHTAKIQRPFSQSTVSLERHEALKPISIEEVNEGKDSLHRERAKELGISYVDYLHMVNNRKLSTTKSEPLIYHKHR